jgi:hypothetical protein
VVSGNMTFFGNMEGLNTHGMAGFVSFTLFHFKVEFSNLILQTYWVVHTPPYFLWKQV